MKFFILVALLAVVAADDYKPAATKVYKRPAATTEHYKVTTDAPKVTYKPDDKDDYKPAVQGEYKPAKDSYKPAVKDAYKPAKDNYKTAAREYDDYEERVAQPFSFGYNIKDSETNADFDHSQKSDGEVVTGSYRIALPDGRTQIVTYKADSYGYTADVKYEGEAKYPEEEEYKSYKTETYHEKKESTTYEKMEVTTKPAPTYYKSREQTVKSYPDAGY